jgi:hypothetical protein
MKAIPGFHPTGVLRTSNFAPGEIVDKPPKAAQIVVAQRRRPEGRGRSPSNPSLSANNEKGSREALFSVLRPCTAHQIPPETDKSAVCLSFKDDNPVQG